MDKREKLVNKLRELEYEYSYTEVVAESNTKQAVRAKEKLEYLNSQYQRVESELSKLDS